MLAMLYSDGWNVSYINESFCNHNANKVKQQDVVLLSETCIWESGTCHLQFIITPDITSLIKRDTEVLERVFLINNLLNTSPCGEKLGTICSSLGCGLFLGEPHHWHQICHVKTTCNRSSCFLENHIIGIKFVM